MAAEIFQLPIAGHISIEIIPSARRVVEAAFPDVMSVNLCGGSQQGIGRWLVSEVQFGWSDFGGIRPLLSGGLWL